MSDLRLSLAPRITTRDGTLDKDSLLKNFYREEQEGKVIAIKRPGYTTAYDLPAGTGQGMFVLKGVSYGITLNTIRRLTDGAAFPLTGAIGTGLAVDIESDKTFGSGLVAVLKTVKNMWVFDGATVTQVVDPDYPADTVRGLVLVDGTYYVMEADGTIHGSAIEDPTSWNPLNFIAVDQSLGTGRRLFRHLNYCFAFNDLGLQAFYDNNNPPPGSPLSPAGNATYLIGCASGDSVVPLDDLTIFISKDKHRGRGVSALQGLSLVPISTPYVDKILNRSNLVNVLAWGARISGHSFYVLTLVDIQVTLVCDMVSKDWQVWTDTSIVGTESNFPFAYYLNQAEAEIAGGRDLLQHYFTGDIVAVSPTVYQDAGLPITCISRSVPYDGQTSMNKFFTELNLIGDQGPTTVQVRYSSDDYQTWSTYRSVDMNTERKMLRELGRARRRAFEVKHTDNTPLRLEGIDFELYLGNS